MIKIKSILDLFLLCLVYSGVMILINVVVLYLIFQELIEVVSYLYLVTLAEGGLGMIVGGFIGLNSPIIRRIEQDFLRSKTPRFKDRKELEKQAKRLIMTGTILVVVALLLSAI